MRIFLGIKLNRECIEKIEEHLMPFKKMGTPIRWTDSENIHLTLKFIGEIPDGLYQKIEEALSRNPFKIKPFRIQISGFGKFGSTGNLSIFWVGARNGGALKELFKQLEEILSRLGIERDQREFSPHITLGRNKKSFHFQALNERIEQSADLSMGEFQVSGFQIFRSDLTRSGPIYTILKEIVFAQE